MENQITTTQHQAGLAHGSKVPGNFLLNLVSKARPETIQIDIVRAQANLTVQTAMAQEHQISFLKKNNPDVLENVISLLLETLAVQFNVKDNFSGIQIVDCTLSIIEKYWYLRPEEIMFAFKQGKLGAYGTVYNKLDTQTILIWLHKYDTEDRIRQVEQIRDSYKKNESEPQIDIVKAYQDEQKAIKENNGTPSLVLQSRSKKEQQQAERRGQIEFSEFKEEYYKNKNRLTEKSNQ